MQIFQMFGTIIINSDQAKKSIDDVTNHAKKSSSKISGFFSGIGKGVSKVTSGLGSMAKGIGMIAGAVGVFRAVDGAINAVSNSIGSAISRFDTLSTYPQILEQMGASSKEAQASIDKLSKGIDGLPTTLDDIAGSAQRMFTILGDAELATESTLALNNAFLASGATTEMASRGMEQYMQMLSAGKVDMQSWRTLQETMPYALKKTAEAFGFTGQSATNDFYSALQDGEITMEEFNAKLIELSNETGGFAEVAKTATGGIATSISIVQSAVTRGIEGVIRAVDEWLAQNGFGGIAEQILRLKGVIDTVFGWIIERVPVVLDTLMSLYEEIKGLFSGESVDFSGIVNLLTQFVPQMVQKGQEMMQGLIQGVSQNLPQITSLVIEVATTWINGLVQMLPMVIELGVQLILSLAQGISANLPMIIQTIIGLVDTLLSTIQQNLPMLLQAGIEIIMVLVDGIIQNLPAIIQAIFNIVTTIVNVVLENLPMIIQAGIEILNAVVQGVTQMLPQLIPMVVNMIMTVVNALISNLPSIIQAGIQLLQALIQGIVSYLPQLISTAITLIIELAGALLANLPQIISAGIQIIIALIGGLIQAIPQLVGAIPQIVTAIFDAFGNVNWGEIGKNIIDGIAKGIGDFAGNLIAKGKEVAEKALGGIKKFLGIESPSRVFAEEVGKWIPAGIAVGIEDNIDLPEDAIRKAISVDNMDFSGTMYGVNKSSETSFNSSGSGIIQNITIHSPRPLNPLETARQIKKASRQLALDN